MLGPRRCLDTSVAAVNRHICVPKATAPRALGPGEVPIRLTINGRAQTVTVEPRVTLLDAVRNRLDYTGSKRVCDRGSCGACTMIVDGRAVYACSTLAIDSQGKQIRTIEGLAQGTVLHPVQQAFCDTDGLMCGFCTPGFVMAAVALLEKIPNPTPAQALVQVARERWRLATGDRLRQVRVREDPWPPSLEPDLADVEVGIARTMPPRGEAPAVREVERLYVDMIAAARREIYIENQYFTAPRLAAALEKRLAEPDGPEIVLVLRLLSHGWLEEHTMHVLRTRLIQRLRQADRYGRFQVYYPHIPGLPESCCLDVHSKAMVVDDAALRIGSANLCNRSMGMDTECDVLIESRGDARVAQTIHAFRDRLLAEHLGVPCEQLAQALERTGSLHRAIAALQTEGRSLRHLEDKEWPEAIVNIASMADPDEPIALDILRAERLFAQERAAERPAWGKLAAFALLIALLAALWRFTPLAEVVTAENTIAWAKEFGSQWWAPLVVMAAYTPACFVMFPRPLITLAAVVAFGPWLGFVYAIAGIVGAAVATYYAGARMRRDTVRRLAGPGLDRMVEVLKKYGLLAMTLLRLVPLAPFAIEGIVAGAVRLKLWHLAAGTAIGMLPGTLATTVFGDQLESALSGGSFNWWVVGGVVALLAAGSWAVKRWFTVMAGRMNEATGQSR